MPKIVTSFYARARQVISGFTLAQRTIAVIGVALLVMGAIALGSWLAKPQMSPLFTGLSASDASAVVEQLKSSGVRYELTEGGATILVPDSQVYNQRLAAAAAGLPGDSSAGYTLLDKMGVTASEFQQSVTYKRAIEGELASTIAAMNGITTATVQLAIPKESVFVSEKQNPTASVFVKTQGSTSLSDDQIDAVVHLTSAAIPGMRPEDVAVTDQNGKVLSAVGVGRGRGASTQAAEHEARVALAVAAMLDTIVGAGNATVTVSADVANSTSERMQETYAAPQGAPNMTEQTKTETYTGGRGGDAGVLGPDNIAVPNGDGSGDYEFEETTRTNAINKSVEKTVTPPGEVTRQTISIAVNREAVTGVSAAQIESLVENAAGINAKRGDTVSVEFVKFSNGGTVASEILAQAEAAQAAERQTEILRSAIIGGAIVLAAIILAVMVAIRGRRKRNAEVGDAMPFETLSLTEEEKLNSLRSLREPVSLNPLTPLKQLPPTILDIEEEPEAEQVIVERRRLEIDQIAKADPAATALALAQMMDEATV